MRIQKRDEEGSKAEQGHKITRTGQKRKEKPPLELYHPDNRPPLSPTARSKIRVQTVPLPAKLGAQRLRSNARDDPEVVELCMILEAQRLLEDKKTSLELRMRLEVFGNGFIGSLDCAVGPRRQLSHASASGWSSTLSELRSKIDTRSTTHAK